MHPTTHPTTTHRYRSRVRRAVPALAVVTALTASAICADAMAGPGHAGASAEPRVNGRSVEIPVNGGTATVDTASLRVDARTDDGHTVRMTDGAATAPGTPEPVTVSGGAAHWSYPGKGLGITARADHGRLNVTAHATTDSTMNWPVTGTDPADTALQLPRGEGLSIPLSDAFWNSPKAQLAGSDVDLAADLAMPLWGYSAGTHGLSYLVPTDIGTTMHFTSDRGRLHTTTSHRFSHGAGTGDYTVTFALTDNSPVAPAVDYRDWLSEHGALGSLRSKIAANPATGKLLGAFHAYLWGDARTPQGIAALRALGVSRMWLGYDADNAPMSAAAVSAAERNGYLVGPYDSFANGQDAATADSPTSAWPGTVYPDFCVRGTDGKPAGGFHGRGCYLSSQAFEQAEPGHHYLADRSKQMTANGADSYFLDVDAAGQLFRDFDPAHPMTEAQDRANRLARMARLSSGDKLVLGSEAAGSWANGVLAFDHGAATPVADGLWPLERDKQNWGGYAPAGAPATFFKPTTLTPEVAKAMYDPRYRIPLYETALHGSVVNAERWELSFDKLPAQKTTRALLAMLYNIPLNFVLNGPSLKQHGAELAALQKYFAPLHQAAGTERMTSFQWLTGDHTVQRTVFGDGTLTVTANFGDRAHGSLPAGCVDARLRGDHAPRRLCPSTVDG